MRSVSLSAEAADAVMTYKLVVKEIAMKHGVYASFMPKPMAGEPGSGMHVHQSLSLIHISDGKWYYFEGSGAMRSGGWMKQGSSWYYLSGSGAMQTGWLSKGGSWYWLDPESGRMATGLSLIHI